MPLEPSKGFLAVIQRLHRDGKAVGTPSIEALTIDGQDADMIDGKKEEFARAGSDLAFIGVANIFLMRLILLYKLSSKEKRRLLLSEMPRRG